MTSRTTTCAIAVAALSYGVNSARAASPREPHRVAVVVGANRGAVGRPDLRFSYRDAHNMADALVQVGQFAPADVYVLLDPEPSALLATLDGVLRTLADSPGESLLLFYFSGHSDGGALYPAGHPLQFAALRERLENRAATVRIGFIDSCSGGGWTGAKGLQHTEPFPIDVPLQLASEGSVLLASSSGLEAAHESEQILGSFFTHHFVAAMRGAAAAPRGDGVVTITDAFTYARDRTVRDSAVVAERPQHPSFSMNLRGRADLPLARVDSSPTALELRETEGPLQLIDLSSGLVVLEVPSGKRTLRLAVPAGRYLLRRQGDRGTYAREMQVEPGTTGVVTEEDLLIAPFAASTDKGVDVVPPRARSLGPQRYEGATPYGGLLFAFLTGHTTSRNPYGSSTGPDASVWEAVARFGWAFPTLPVGEWFQPQLSFFAEGRLGIADWQSTSGSSFERAFDVRVQANVLRTRYLDLYANTGFGVRRDDPPGGGAFSSCRLNGLPSSECSHDEWRLGAGVEAHLTDKVHVFAEPDFGLSERSRTALRIGILFR
jgi:hypothetical protein